MIFGWRAVGDFGCYVVDGKNKVRSGRTKVCIFYVIADGGYVYFVKYLL